VKKHYLKLHGKRQLRLKGGRHIMAWSKHAKHHQPVRPAPMQSLQQRQASSETAAHCSSNNTTHPSHKPVDCNMLCDKGHLSGTHSMAY